jgi:hypothetical protein
MKAEILPEPELEFGAGGRHIDIRIGITQYGPLDRMQPAAPNVIRLGVVGTTQSVSGVRDWLTQCAGGIPAKPSRQPNLFPAFPGCGPDLGLRASIVMTPDLLREVPQPEITALVQSANGDELVEEGVRLFLREFEYLQQNTNVDVLSG